MAQETLLLVDADTQHLRVMEVSLRKAGYSVVTARDGADALTKLESAQPDLIISDTDMPNLSGYDLCQRVKGSAHNNTAFLFLTRDNSMNSKVRGLELGADDFLIRPIYTRELIARVGMILEKRAREVLSSSTSQQRYFGQLSHMSVVDLLQAMELGRRQGTVHIKTEGNEGTLWFRDGAPVDANAGALQGADAVYRMLTWETGSFEIDFRTPRRPEAMSETVNTLVAEGMRQASEWSAVAEQLPPLSSVFTVNYDELSDRLADLPDEVNALIRLFDGRRSARDAITESGLADLAALEAVSRLYFEGIIAIDENMGRDEEPAEPVPQYETSLPPSIQPSVADALLQSVEELSAQPLGIPPVDSRSVPAAAVPPPPPKEAMSAETDLPPSVDPDSHQDPANSIQDRATEEVFPSPPAPPPEAIASPDAGEDTDSSEDDLASAVASIQTAESIPSEPTASTSPSDSIWDLTKSAQASQKKADAAADSLRMVLMDEDEQEHFPEFEAGATLSDDLKEDAFFADDDAFSGPIQDDFFSVPDDIDEEEEEETKGSSPFLALVMVGVILLGGGGWFFLRDTVSALDDIPNNYLNQKWASETAKKKRLSPDSLVAERKEAKRLEAEIAELEAQLDGLDEEEQNALRATIQGKHDQWKIIDAKLPRPVDVEWTIPKGGGSFPEASDMASDAQDEEISEDENTEDELANADTDPEENDEISENEADTKQPEPVAKAASQNTPSVEVPKTSTEDNLKRSRELAAEAEKLYKKEDFKGAAGRYEKSLAMGPGSFPSLLGYAKTLIELNRPKEAIEAAEKATRIKKNHPDAYLLLGDANQSLNRIDKSVEAYEKYLAIAPNGRYAGEVKMILRNLRK